MKVENCIYSPQHLFSAASSALFRMSEILYFIDKYHILEVGTNTSDHYGQIKSQLKLSAKPIPENDIWIAAIAKEYNLILMSCHTYSDVSLRTPNQPAGWHSTTCWLPL